MAERSPQVRAKTKKAKASRKPRRKAKGWRDHALTIAKTLTHSEARSDTSVLQHLVPAYIVPVNVLKGCVWGAMPEVIE